MNNLKTLSKEELKKLVGGTDTTIPAPVEEPNNENPDNVAPPIRYTGAIRGQLSK